MTSRTEDAVRFVEVALSEAANPGKADGMPAYMKTEMLHFQ